MKISKSAEQAAAQINMMVKQLVAFQIQHPNAECMGVAGLGTIIQVAIANSDESRENKELRVVLKALRVQAARFLSQDSVCIVNADGMLARKQPEQAP